jgi:hypothetical protein
MKSFTHCPICNESFNESGLGCECVRGDRLANFLRMLEEPATTSCSEEQFAAWEAASHEASMNFKKTLRMIEDGTI